MTNTILIFILFPLIGALIGWFTNFLAVKMLFHPREKKVILGIEVQGIFPKRQDAIAEKLGRIVARELISFEEIKERITDPSNLGGVNEIISSKVDEYLFIKLPQQYPMLGMFLTEKNKIKFKEQLVNEVKDVLPSLIENFINKTEKNLDIEQMVYQKVAAFSSDKLENMLQSILSKEFRFIELVGGVLGFFIGLVQAGLSVLLN